MPRQHVNIRIHTEWIDQKAAEHHVSRSDVIREALAVAAAHENHLDKRLQALKPAPTPPTEKVVFRA